MRIVTVTGSRLRVGISQTSDCAKIAVKGIERVETNLLTAFHGWAQTYERERRN